MEHQTALYQTLQKQLARSLARNVSTARAIARMMECEQKQMRDVRAIIAGVIDYEQKQMSKISATIARAVEAYQYQQKQAILKFPDIIRGELPVNPPPIPIPSRRSTPLLEPPPTANTGKVYEEIIPASSAELVPITNHKQVFIVHGHDHASRDIIADFVNNWGLIPIVLDKQLNKGRTIIEKFEDLADESGFAIVLFTPDDVGGVASAKHMGELKYRARQNVILELGYLLKTVGRQQVCILHKGDIELPSDIHGLLYIPMDDAGKWKEKVIREMVEAKVLANANKI